MSRHRASSTHSGTVLCGLSGSGAFLLFIHLGRMGGQDLRLLRSHLQICLSDIDLPFSLSRFFTTWNESELATSVNRFEMISLLCVYELWGLSASIPRCISERRSMHVCK